MTVTVFSTDGSREPCSYDVSVPKFGTLSDLVQALSIACLLGDDEILLVTEVSFPFLVAPSDFFAKFRAILSNTSSFALSLTGTDYAGLQ